MPRATREQWRRYLWLAAGILLLIGVIGVYYISLAPRNSVRRQAIEIAQTRADVTKVGEFYWDTQRESYLTVAGTTKKKAKVYVVIRQKTGKVTVLAQKEGLTAAEATAKVNAEYAPQKILSIGLGKRGSAFVWDIGYRTKAGKLGYVAYNFETGKRVFAVENL